MRSSVALDFTHHKRGRLRPHQNLFSRSLLALATAVLTSACSKDEEAPYDMFTPDNFVSVETSLQQAPLRCASSGECPDKVGLIYFAPKPRPTGQLGICSGFWVSRDTVATNEHCIPEHLKSRQNSCQGQFAIKFLQQGQPRLYRCLEILDESPVVLKADGTQDFLHPDYAFVRVQPLHGESPEPLKITKAGFDHHEAVKMMVVTPIKSSSGGGVIEPKNCRAVHGSLYLPQVLFRWRSIMAFHGCDVVKGNSGSPVLNSRGEVGAIVSATLKNETSAFTEEEREKLKRLGLWTRSWSPPYFDGAPSRPKDLSVGTNMACVSESFSGLSPASARCNKAKALTNEACFLPVKTIGELLNNDPTQPVDDSTLAIALWKASLPQVFDYEFEVDAIGGGVRAKPRCVNAREIEDLIAHQTFAKTYPLTSQGVRLLMRPETPYVEHLEVYWHQVFRADLNREVDSGWTLTGYQLGGERYQVHSQVMLTADRTSEARKTQLTKTNFRAQVSKWVGGSRRVKMSRLMSDPSHRDQVTIQSYAELDDYLRLSFCAEDPQPASGLEAETSIIVRADKNQSKPLEEVLDDQGLREDSHCTKTLDL